MQSSVVGGNEDKKSVNEGALARMDLFSIELDRGTVRILTLSLPPSLPPHIFSIFSMSFFLCPPSPLFFFPPPYSLSSIFLPVEGEGFGLHIAEGYAQTRKGLEVGVFVKEIVPNSAADRNGQ